MKTIIQHDERDCGAACLSMIAMYYGLKHPLSKYRELTKTELNGTNLYGIVDAAQKIGFESEALSGGKEELLIGLKTMEIGFPFVAHIINEDSMQHFIVVFDIRKGKVVVGDPAKGKIKYTLDAFFELWTGYIVTFKKSQDFKEGNYIKGTFTRFFSLLRGQYKILTSVVAMSIIISIIGIFGAFVFEVIIDNFYSANESVVCEDGCQEDHEHVVEQNTDSEGSLIDKIINFITNNASNFNLFFVSLIALYFLQAIIQFLRGYLMSVLSKNIDLKLLNPYYNHIMDLPISAINTRNTGEYISRFSDSTTIRTAISGATLTLVLDSLMVVGCGVILFLENKLLFLISFIMIVLYSIVILCYRKPIAQINHTVMEDNGRVQSYLKESIDGIETLKSYSAENIAKKNHSQKFYFLIKAVFKNNILSTSQDSICDLIELVGTVVILWIGFGLVLGDVVTIGSLITFYALLAYFIEPIKNLIELQPMMQTAVVAAERLNDILDIQSEDNNIAKDQSIYWDNIKFSNVDFRYGNHELVLKNISFELNKGEKIAFVGESGCGKTTIAKILLKFYQVENGSIVVDGIDYTDLAISSIRNDVAYVDQNTFLFSDTIKNNLLLANANATDEEIATACRLSKANEFIEKLPFGYETFLDENGKNLSGGQRQRLAIARALLKNPKVLILDEATSNLDTITESAIKDTIFDLNKEMTCIIIAHRLSTIKNCDKIIVMDKSCIVEIGTHDELMHLQGKYFELYNRQ